MVSSSSYINSRLVKAQYSSCGGWPANQMNYLGNMVTAPLMWTGTLHCYCTFSKLLYCSESVQAWIVSYRDLNRLPAVGNWGFGTVGDRGFGGGQKSRPTVQEPGRSIDSNWKLKLPVTCTVVLISLGFDFLETLRIPYLGNSYNVCVTVYTDSCWYIVYYCSYFTTKFPRSSLTASEIVTNSKSNMYEIWRYNYVACSTLKAIASCWLDLWNGSFCLQGEIMVCILKDW